MLLSAFTAIHVAISLLGILSGLVVVYGMISNKKLNGWTRIFLATTFLTSFTGFFFPFKGITPGIVVGIISLVVLAVAYEARYRRDLAGGWRTTYVVSATVALYFNVFVLIVQLFEKMPALNALAPTQSEPPFKVVQGAVLVLFIAAGIAAAKKFREVSAPRVTATRA
jgi:hypothetical protein